MNLPRAHHRLSMTPSFLREARLIYDTEIPEPDNAEVARIMEEAEREAARSAPPPPLEDDPFGPPSTPRQTTEYAQREQEQKALITRMLTTQDQLVRQMEAELRQTYQDKIDALAEKRSLDELINRAMQRGGNVNLPKWNQERQAALDRFGALDARQKSLFAQMQPEKERLNAMLAGDPAAFTGPIRSQSQFAPPALPAQAPVSAPTDAGSSSLEDIASQSETLMFDQVEPVRKAEIQKILDQFEDSIDANKRTNLVSQLLMQGVHNAKDWENSGTPKPEDLQIYKMGTFPFMICVISGMVMQLKNLFPKKAERAEEGAEKTREQLKKEIEDKKKEIDEKGKTPDAETSAEKTARENELNAAKEALVKLEDQLAQKTWEEATADLQDLDETSNPSDVQKEKLKKLATLVTGENAPKEQLGAIFSKLSSTLPEEIKVHCNTVIEKANATEPEIQKALKILLSFIAENAICQRSSGDKMELSLKEKSPDDTGMTSILTLQEWRSNDACLEAFEDLMK